jgi:hypothetical protein
LPKHCLFSPTAFFEAAPGCKVQHITAEWRSSTASCECPKKDQQTHARARARAHTHTHTCT